MDGYFSEGRLPSGFLAGCLNLWWIKGVGRIMAADNSDLSRRARFFIFPPLVLSRLGSFLIVRLSTEADKRGRSISLVTLARVASLGCLLWLLLTMYPR